MSRKIIFQWYTYVYRTVYQDIRKLREIGLNGHSMKCDSIK